MPVRGIVLFLVFINDLPPKEVDCQVALFADDTLMHQTIKCSHDTLKFQENLTALSKWVYKWEWILMLRKAKSCFSSVKANCHTTHFMGMS